jgi:hypothetical protein
MCSDRNLTALQKHKSSDSNHFFDEKRKFLLFSYFNAFQSQKNRIQLYVVGWTVDIFSRNVLLSLEIRVENLGSERVTNREKSKH